MVGNEGFWNVLNFDIGDRYIGIFVCRNLYSGIMIVSVKICK